MLMTRMLSNVNEEEEGRGRRQRRRRRRQQEGETSQHQRRSRRHQHQHHQPSLFKVFVQSIYAFVIGVCLFKNLFQYDNVSSIKGMFQQMLTSTSVPVEDVETLARLSSTRPRPKILVGIFTTLHSDVEYERRQVIRHSLFELL